MLPDIKSTHPLPDGYFSIHFILSPALPGIFLNKKLSFHRFSGGRINPQKDQQSPDQQ